MNTFEALKESVRKRGYGTAFYGNVNGSPVYLSRGVREIFLGDDDSIQKVIDAVIKFENGDFGDAGEHGKSSSAGHEYGRYDIALFDGETGDDTGVWIHKDGQAVIVYFGFER